MKLWLAVGLALTLSAPVWGQVSGAEQQQAVSITVYNSNLGLVRDVRTLKLAKGVQALKFSGVASKIDPATVYLKSLTNPSGLSILEQNYEYDLLSPEKLLDKYVGKKVTLVLKQTQDSTDKFIPTEATLLANNEGQVWQIGSQIVTNPTNIAEIRFPQLPEGLIAKPTLVWQLDNNNSNPQTVEVSYLTDGISWKADYVLVLNPEETQAGLNSWVTLENNSGTEYRNAQLQLVAGEINRVNLDSQRRIVQQENTQTTYASAAPAFKQENLFEYYLYTLSRPTTLKNAQTKQISLLEAQGIEVRKQFILLGQPGYYRDYNQPGEPIREKIGVYIEFTNSEQNKLGQPLPAGIFRLYKADSNGGQQFLGEDRINHTPRNENIQVKVGDAFDVVAERKQTDYKRIDDKQTEYAYEISLRNRKKEAITVVVNEFISGDWAVLASSFPSQKTTATAVRFNVPIQPDGTAVLTYRVRVRY
ncbi:DUF4139 domain-containing protein [Candidatus Cyanaurora vandensis]|uniref:DUF4139 domain-containing protein n=1 Tax=Candidatus Cyanaurora vandensis TaxID=2714958 RepID=UPI00257D1927|nr:DUF4139 domain-containing protein [Candidatus Cyanaurora vandensis]